MNDDTKSDLLSYYNACNDLLEEASDAIHTCGTAIRAMLDGFRDALLLMGYTLEVDEETGQALSVSGN